jgi:enamine deaminase RidA (YjgF/YER057c/UK114 family)
VCEEYGVKLLAYGTLAGGFLSEKWLGAPEPDEPATWSQMKYKRFIDTAGGWERFQQVLSTASEVAKKHDVTVPVVASRYMLDRPAVAGVILGARLDNYNHAQANHVQENLAIFDLTLDQNDKDAIAGAIENLDKVHANCGDEYRKPPFLTAAGDLSDHLESIPLSFEPQKGEGGRQRVFSGVSWETFAGYCRAVRDGDRILVSGTTATHGDRVIGGDDAAAQTHFVIDKIEAAIESLGGRLEEVIRTRIFVSEIEDWEAVAQAHGERFGHIQPANSLVQARLIGDAYRVEIEAEASLTSK